MPVVDAETLSFALKTPWSDGTAHLLSPHQLLEKLAALVLPPWLNDPDREPHVRTRFTLKLTRSSNVEDRLRPSRKDGPYLLDRTF